MFKLDNVKVLHLEPTSNCNAACPQCHRFVGNSINPAIELSDLPLETIKNNLSEKFVKQLDKMFMCGNFGDPAASKYTLDIYKWFREVNPDIKLGMNTNGGLKNTDWWEKLAGLINRELDYVVFSIDGLEDTNHIYRRKVNWQKLMENVTAFISSGGRAQWDMLVFKHNEHQIEQARQLSKDLGFVEFRYKVSKRHLSKPIDFLSPPDSLNIVFENQPTTINCHALEHKSIYMDYRGVIFPCCWLGSTGQSFSLDFIPKLEVPMCKKTCGVTDSLSNFEKQWVES
jgi:MoaA/NifB/PqqE/SkfB family radical SAM enzyme